MRISQVGVILATLLITSPIIAEDMIQVGRYSKIPNTPTAEQLNPLRVIIKTKMPQSVKTVGEAVDFLLVRSGYSLVDRRMMSDETKELMDMALPRVHRSIGPLTLDVALRSLSGHAFELVVDPVRRKVTYELASRIKIEGDNT